MLATGIRSVRNVGKFVIGLNAMSELGPLLDRRRLPDGGRVVFFVDQWFKGRRTATLELPSVQSDFIFYVRTDMEPTTDYIDSICEDLIKVGLDSPVAIVGVGGGTTMDVAKAVSNLLTNGGAAADYQGWDLLRRPGIFKVAIPTISGTGAEATRTCVMTNPQTGLKLGMNSDFSVFDVILMDPSLTATVPRNQYFYTGMDAYIHCMESLAGRYRNAVGDALSRETLNICRDVFLTGDMMDLINREKLMVASYLGGCAIATSYVGLVHPLSAALSVVLGLHHCVSNCIVMRAMEPYYPEGYDEFWKMVEHQSISIPVGVASSLTDSEYQRLYEATTMHAKPLTNALGEDFLTHLSFHRVRELFKQM